MTGYTGNTITVPADFSNCTKQVTLLQLEEYKKVFQSFWVRMIEQFVPATTIFVSGVILLTSAFLLLDIFDLLYEGSRCFIRN